jgi:toxin ParE1/3/4
VRIELSPLIETDLDEIAAYIARHNPTRAVSFVQDIRHEFLNIGRNPDVYRARPDLGVNARISTVGRYLILFRTGENVVQIRRVLHGARNLSGMHI